MKTPSSSLLIPLTVSGLILGNSVSHAIVRALKRTSVALTPGQSLPSMLHLAAEQAGMKQVTFYTVEA